MVGREGQDLLGALWPEHVFLINCQGVLLNYLHSAEVKDAGEMASLSSFITYKLVCNPYLFVTYAFILCGRNQIFIYSIHSGCLILDDENHVIGHCLNIADPENRDTNTTCRLQFIKASFYSICIFLLNTSVSKTGNALVSNIMFFLESHRPLGMYWMQL